MEREYEKFMICLVTTSYEGSISVYKEWLEPTVTISTK
jgi:hypothetical protein